MRLVVNGGAAKGRFIKVTGPRFLIGRGAECQLRPHSDEVGRRHAEVKVISGIVLINDLGSVSGTRVNGQKLSGPASLRTGDVVEIGPLSFTVLLDERRAARRPKRLTEEEIASWLVDEDEGDEAVPPPRTQRAATAPATRASADRGEDAFELLKAMTTRTE
jgi:pSer/pThr/pTyr-binding forkhead associated (FHA) protein